MGFFLFCFLMVMAHRRSPTVPRLIKLPLERPTAPMKPLSDECPWVPKCLRMWHSVTLRWHSQDQESAIPRLIVVMKILIPLLFPTADGWGKLNMQWKLHNDRLENVWTSNIESTIPRLVLKRKREINFFFLPNISEGKLECSKSNDR